MSLVSSNIPWNTTVCRTVRVLWSGLCCMPFPQLGSAVASTALNTMQIFFRIKVPIVSVQYMQYIDRNTAFIYGSLHFALFYSKDHYCSRLTVGHVLMDGFLSAVQKTVTWFFYCFFLLGPMPWTLQSYQKTPLWNMACWSASGNVSQKQHYSVHTVCVPITDFQ